MILKKIKLSVLLCFSLYWIFVFIGQGTIGVPYVLASEVKYLCVQHVMDIHGEFNKPTEVVVNKRGRIYVLDGANNSIKIFNTKGKMLLAFG